ncbi:MAG: LytTR family transcriptional regulator [Bacteroidales bacterium]|nr:LytTR family transcriptional regulator [Bacteroidales bacterium]
MSKRHTILNTFFIFILSSVAIVFYFIFMGSTDLSILTLLKVFIICLAPPLVILIYDRMKELNLQNESLIPENESFINRTDKPRIEKENKFIEFISNSKTDKFSLPAGQVICLKSADNYVEVIYRENDLIRKKLIRNTLVNIEQKIVNFTSFVRCHRICIVNLNNVESFARNCNRYNLVLTGLNEKIPVSQQYFIKVKMALSNA